MSTAKKLLSLFLSLTLAAAIAATVLLASVAELIKQDNTEIIADRVFESLDTEDIALRTSLGKKSVASILLSLISDCPGADRITEKQIADALTSKFLKEFTEELLDEFYDPSVSDPLDIGLKPSAICKFLERNQKTLSALAADNGYSGGIDVKGNKEQILNKVSKLLGKDGVTLDCLLADGALKDNLGQYLDAGRSLLTPKVLLIACGVTGFIAILLLAVCFANGVDYLAFHHQTVNSTPESVEIYRYLRYMLDEGVKACVLEVSSQALWMGRTRGLIFDTVLFTTLSRDHIGGVEHPDFEHYRDCKRLLFTDYPANMAVVNRDDGHSRYMAEGTSAPVLDFGLCEPADTDKPLWGASDIRPMQKGDRIGVGFEAYRKGAPTEGTWFLPLPGCWHFWCCVLSTGR